MPDLRSLAPSCGVLVGVDAHGRFEHLATAWCVGGGISASEWVSAWAGPDDEPPTGVRLITADGGQVTDTTAWEIDNGIAAFTVRLTTQVPALPVRRGSELHKRDPLVAVGYPSMIDHPAFQLHRGSLDPERYFPYLCPWVISGHLALFTADDGWLTGRCYGGMGGGPVLDSEGHVVGVLLDGQPAPDHPPLARFRRLD